MTNIKYMVTGSITSAIIVGTALLGQHAKISKLEKEVQADKAKIEIASSQRDYFRKQLIKNGNPEEWTINGNEIGQVWYERVSDFGTGTTRESMNYP